MKRAMFSVVSAAVLAAVSACDKSPTFADPSSLAISVSVEPDSVVPGNTMWITVKAKNPTRRLLRYEYIGCDGGIGYSVTTSEGDKAGGIMLGNCIYFTAPEKRVLEIGPGEEVEQRFSWTATHNYYKYGLHPGEYKVVGWFHVDSRAETSEAVSIDVLSMLPLEVESRPSDAAAGETVSIQVGVTNASSGPVEGVPVFSSCGFGVWIKRDGQFIDHLTECSSPDSLMTLTPGQRIEGVVTWQPSEPGDYEILVQLAWPGQANSPVIKPLRVR